MNRSIVVFFGLGLVFFVLLLTVYSPYIMETSRFQFLKIDGSFHLLPKATLIDLTRVANQSSTDDSSLSQIRILCFVSTSGKYIDTRAKSVNDTWSKHCNYFYFVTNETHSDFPIVTYEGDDAYNKLWGKTKTGFKHAFDHYFEKADWFFKGDDDTFLIIENLRKMLVNYQPSDPIWFGCKFRIHVDYMSGGGGYVLSKEALRRLVKIGFEDKESKICRMKDDEGSEDVEMGTCLKNVNVTPGDSTDPDDGRHRFFALAPENIIPPNRKSATPWYWQYLLQKGTDGLGCCSNVTISFHYVNELQMYTLYFFTYFLQV